MPLIILDCKITGKPPKEISRKMPKIYKASLQAVAEFWHSNLLQSHFTPRNDARYQYSPRNKVYLQDIKSQEGVGQGKYVSDLLKGMAARWVRTFATVSGTSKSATIRMTAPTYFEHPFIGSFIDPKNGRMKHVTRQPNKPEEITQVNRDDREALMKFAQADVQLRVELAMRGI